MGNSSRQEEFLREFIELEVFWGPGARIRCRRSQAARNRRHGRGSRGLL